MKDIGQKKMVMYNSATVIFQLEYTAVEIFSHIFEFFQLVDHFQC